MLTGKKNLMFRKFWTNKKTIVRGTWNRTKEAIIGNSNSGTRTRFNRLKRSSGPIVCVKVRAVRASAGENYRERKVRLGFWKSQRNWFLKVSERVNSEKFHVLISVSSLIITPILIELQQTIRKRRKEWWVWFGTWWWWWCLCVRKRCSYYVQGASVRDLLERERVVRGTKALSFFNFRVSLHRSLLQINPWTASLWLVLAFL